MNSPRFCRDQLFVAAALAFLVICSPKMSALTVTPENVDWALIEMNGKSVATSVEKHHAKATLTLDHAKKQYSGVSFVNLYHGKYELQDHKLAFHLGAETLMYSNDPALNHSKQSYLEMLSKVTGWQIENENLELLQGTKVVAKFAKNPSSPTQS